MKGFWHDVKDVYGSAWAFAFACPILFLVPVIAEFAQHVVEVQGGMYQSAQGARDAAADPARMQWGFIKTLAITLPSYWMYRYVVSGRSAAYARTIEVRALALWLAIYAFMSLLTWLGLFGPALGDLLGLEGRAATVVRTTLTVVQVGIGIYLTAWFVAWSQGNAAVGPVQSFRIMRGFFWRTLLLILAGIVPLMALHYTSLLAIGRPEAVVWAVMVFDSLVVGFLSLTIYGANAVAACRAAAAKGVTLRRGSPRDEVGKAAATA